MTTPSPSPLSPHPHAAVIKAWADGAEIEWRIPGDKDWHPAERPTPRWYVHNEYRVKPADPPILTPHGEDDLRHLLLEAEILQLRMAATGAMEMAHQARSSNLLHDREHFRQTYNRLNDLANRLEKFL